MTMTSISIDENIPPHLCLPEMDGEVMCMEGPVCTSLLRQHYGRQDSHSPKSISLLDIDTDDLHEFASCSSGGQLPHCGGIEVEITPDLAARFNDLDYHHQGERSEVLDVNVVELHTPDFVAARRRSLSQTAASFPSHIPFPSLDSPQNSTRPPSPPVVHIAPKPTVQKASQWTGMTMESLQKMDVDSGAEQKRMNSAASVGVDSILSGMRQHRDNDRVQRYGCGALQKLACQSDTNRALIARAGGVLDILTAMDSHLERASIQECGCLALSSLSKAGIGNISIARHSGIETILRAMRAHVEHEAVQKHACLVLLSLACSSVTHNAVIATLGGIEDIMAAMSCHPGNNGIKEYGSAALWSLAYMNSHNGAAIEKAGGQDAIFDVLNTTDKSRPRRPSLLLSQEDQCLQVINKQKTGESDDQDTSQTKGRRGVDAILSVFVRPLQQ